MIRLTGQNGAVVAVNPDHILTVEGVSLGEKAEALSRVVMTTGEGIYCRESLGAIVQAIDHAPRRSGWDYGRRAPYDRMPAPEREPDAIDAKLCPVCHVRPVDWESGLDTCEDCARRV
jgi:uncharacterized protein YlzI (FlbEa/FlbD family)